MKRALYSLENEEFLFFVNKIGEKLRARKIPHIFVGGTAVQAYVLDKLHKKENLSIGELIANENIRLQDYVRATDDIDLALKFSEDGENEIKTAKIINDLCEDIEGEDLADTDNYIFKFTLERKGIKRPIFGVSVFDERAESITLKISRKSKDLKGLDNKFYNEFINSGRELFVPHYEGSNLRVRVPKLEHVLATKISNYRAKDGMDIDNLVRLSKDLGEKLDMEEIQRILLPVHTKEYERFEFLIETLNH